MKSLSNQTTFRKGLFNLLIIGISLMVMSFVNTNSYQIVSSKFSISGSGKISDWNLKVDTSTCEGSFSAEGGELQSITNLRFNFPISKLKSENQNVEETIKSSFANKSCDEITFNQKSVMILPIMKMVHLVGEIKIGNGIHNVPMQMQYVINDDQTITLYAKQFVKLSEFGITLPNIKPGDIEEEVTINIALNLKKKQPSK